MFNFEFHNPTRVLFGLGQIANIGEEIPQEAKVLLLYGGGSAVRSGVLDEVKAALGEREYREFGGIESNPSYETLMPAVELVKREKITFLLTIGGGSVIDGTKFVAAASC